MMLKTIGFTGILAFGFLGSLRPGKHWRAKDALIPIGTGRDVFNLSAATDKVFHALKGAGHNNVWGSQKHKRFFSSF